MSIRETTEISQSEYAEQKVYIDKLKNIIKNTFTEKGKTPFAHVATYGCAMNAHDSETIEGMLTQMGYIMTDDEKIASVIVYNTCCVRENAENKVYGNLGFLKAIKQENKDLKIILCGCMMQQDAVIEKIKKAYRHVDVIFGTYNLHRLPTLLYTSFETKGQVIDVWKEHGEIVEDMPSVREKKYRASVNIMYGCNNFCSYCIVPYVRGRERSRNMEDILTEINTLADDGVVEVTLLGQNVNSYGNDLKNENAITFPNLLREINKIDKVKRIKFMTSHPKDISDDLILAMKECEKVIPYLHLPVQSGNNEILKKMNRKYTREHYLQVINKLKKQIPDIHITTDLIVGFPSETNEHFEDTLKLVEEVGFSGAFTFIYSKRDGTPAALMEEQVDEKSIKYNFNRLLELVNKSCYDTNAKKINTYCHVLVEEVNGQNEELVTGRNEYNGIVHIKGDSSLIGKIVKVKIVDFKSFYLVGEIENNINE